MSVTEGLDEHYAHQCGKYYGQSPNIVIKDPEYFNAKLIKITDNEYIDPNDVSRVTTIGRGCDRQIRIVLKSDPSYIVIRGDRQVAIYDKLKDIIEKINEART